MTGDKLVAPERPPVMVTVASLSVAEMFVTVEPRWHGTFTGSVECADSSQCNGGSTPNINDLHFDVTNRTVAQLETTNANGNFFVADILCGQTGCTGLTGPVDVSAIPAPIIGHGRSSSGRRRRVVR
jgi:hypothetical protein